MFYSNYDCDFLRLCGLCRYIPTDLHKRFDSIIFHKDVISYMQTYRLIKKQSDKKSFKLTDYGRKVLLDMNWRFKQDARMNIHRNGYKRKVDSAKLTILLHLAGINVFCKNLHDLNENEIGYIVKTEMYDEYSQKVLANTRFLGLLKIHDTVYVPYYVEGYDDWILPNYERETFMRLINELKNVRNVKIMLVGENLRNLYLNTVFFNPPTEELGQGKEYFKVALEKLGGDIVWVPLNQDGVLQMSILMIPDYKERIIKAMKATESAPEYNLCDAIVKNYPMVVSLDMNIKNKFPAIRQALKVDKEHKAVIACMESQKENVVKILRYFKENCLVFGITHAELRGVFKDDIKDYIPEPYLVNGKMIEVYPPECVPDEPYE